MTKHQVDTLKGIAILEVVWIHFSSIFPEAWWLAYDGRSLFFVVVDQLCRMSIPVFIFLSWYGLSKKYQGKPVPLVGFFKARFTKLVPLYLIWAVGIWTMMHLVTNWGFNLEIPLPIKLVMGQADYHLYFIPLIVMMYILFAAYTFLPRRARLYGLLVVGLLTAAWYWYLPMFRANFPWLQPDQIQNIMPLTWLWYAWLGGVAADFNWSEKLAKPWVKKVLLVGLVLAALWAITDTYHATHQAVFEQVLFATEFVRPQVVVYATAMILFLLGTVGHWGNKSKGVLNWINQIGIYSFLVFLAHTTFIRLIPDQILHPVPLLAWLSAACLTALLLILSKFFLV